MNETKFREARIAFIEAECFLLAANYILQKDDESPYIDMYLYVGVGTASQVNHAFATEMYLKCLQIITDTYNPDKKQHHLGVLFDKLPNDCQKKINDRYEKVYQKDDEDLFDKKAYSLQELLHLTGNFFKAARYSFSKKTYSRIGEKYRLTIGINAIRDILLEYSPELKASKYVK